MSWPSPSLPHGKADLIPVEILSEIFLLIVQGSPWHRTKLSLVCRRWHAIILSTPGIQTRLMIRRATQKEDVQAFVQGTKTRLNVTVDTKDERDGGDFNAENFIACFMAAAQAASRWSSLRLISPPPHGDFKGLQILQPLERLEVVSVAGGCGKFFEQLLNAISNNVYPNLTTVFLADPVAVPYLVQPVGLYITHSLTTLEILLPKRMDTPVDILPHLHRLETLEARHLFLPFYPPDAPLPLTHTLHSLYLRCVSVQWMAGHVFPAIKMCSIVFPHHGDILQALQPVTMPSCFDFTYHSNNLHPLTRFYLPPLRTLHVKCGQWNVWRGNPQLAVLCPLVASGANSLTSLTLAIECSEQLLVYMLSLVPALQFLELRLARPNSLSTTFFQAFIVREPNGDSASDMVGPPSQPIAPLCPSLHSLCLHYRRWLRGPDNKALIVALSGIVASRVNSILHLELSFDGRLGSRYGARWLIREPVRKPQNLECVELILGTATPHGTIPVSVPSIPYYPISLPFKEADYLRLRCFSSLEFRFTHDHMELMTVRDYGRPPRPGTSLPCALPLFSELRVLVVEYANPSFLAGHAFHKLERCRVVKSPNPYAASPGLFTETVMPLCTRLDIDNPYLLATFKLPQIREVALDFSHPECSTIWEKRITVNANLSELNLLHMKGWPFDGDLIPILRSLPSLETLIISSQLGVVSFRAFLPMGAYGTSGIKQTSGEGQRLPLLCPRLQCLQIEGQSPLVEPELKPILKDIVTLRAKCGSPLKNFTFSAFRPSLRSNLIGRNGRFTMKNIDPPEKTERFKLDI